MSGGGVATTMAGSDDPQAGRLPGSVHVEHAAIRVPAVDPLVPFYDDVIGLEVRRDADGAALAAGDRVLLELVEAPDAPPRRPTEAGLFHLAIRVPDRAALADALQRIRSGDASLDGASDHLVSEALYLSDPAGNGLELYWDRPSDGWPRGDDGRIRMDTLPLDLEALSGLAGGASGLPAGADLGHVHLEVTDLDRARAFYADTLGFRVQAPDHRTRASFLAADDYHHHVGLNAWNDRTEPNGETRGLEWYELVVPDAEATERLRMRVDASQRRGDLAVTDPDGIELRLTVEP